MRVLQLFVLLFISSFAHSQHEFQSWIKLGAEGEITKNLDWSIQLQGRFSTTYLESYFPQIGLEYRVKKWFSPSIEYRFISDRDKYSNYLGGHRINVNANFKKKLKRFTFSTRLRYQYAFQQIGISGESNPDFDQAIRAKLNVRYKIKKSPLTPMTGVEIFYDPLYGPNGPGFSKLRSYLGTNLDLTGPHKVSIKYQIDLRLNKSSANIKHIAAVSYAYKF